MFESSTPYGSIIITPERIKLNANFPKEINKFHHTKPYQIAKEPNAINIPIEYDATKKIDIVNYIIFAKDGIEPIADYLWAKIIGNHSDYKTPETLDILEKIMEENKK